MTPTRQLELLSVHEFENRYLARRFLGTDTEATLAGVATAPRVRLGVTRENFLRLPDLIALVGARAVPGQEPRVAAFPVEPLVSLADRFETYWRDLGAVAAALPGVHLEVVDPELWTLLRHVSAIAASVPRKRLLLALGAVCDEVLTGPWRVLIDPTTVCNLNCLYCRTFSPLVNPEHLPHSGRARLVPFDVLQRVLEDCKALGVEIVSLVGGAEPLTVPYLDDLLRELGRLGMRMDLSTNGTLMNRERANAMIASGCFDSVTVSVSAATAETYGVMHPANGHLFGPLLENLRTLVSLRREAGVGHPRLSFLFALTRLNVHELEAAVELAADLGCDIIKFQLLHVDDWNRHLKLDPEQAGTLSERLRRAKARAEERGLYWDTYIEPQQAGLDQERGSWSDFMFRRGCLVGWYFSYLSFKQDVMLCCGQKEISTLDRHRGSFVELWRSERYRLFRLHAKHLGAGYDLRCDNGRLLADAFCRCCDNHHFQREVETMLHETELERFMTTSRKDFDEESPLRLLGLEVLDPLEREEGRDHVLCGAPCYIRVSFEVLRVTTDSLIQLSLVTTHPTEKAIWSTTLLPPERLGPAVLVYRLDRLDLLDDLAPALVVAVVQTAGDLQRSFRDAGLRRGLRVLSPRRKGGGLLPLSHRLTVRNRDLFAPLKRNFRREHLSSNIVLHSAEVTNERGEPTTTLGQGRHRIRFVFSFLDTVLAPLFRLQLFYLEDPEVHRIFFFGTNNYRHGQGLRPLLGRVTVDLELTPGRLPAGAYQLGLSVLQSEAAEACSFLEHTLELSVPGTEVRRRLDDLAPLHGRLVDPQAPAEVVRRRFLAPALAAALGVRAGLWPAGTWAWWWRHRTKGLARWLSDELDPKEVEALQTRMDNVQQSFEATREELRQLAGNLVELRSVLSQGGSAGKEEDGERS